MHAEVDRSWVVMKFGGTSVSSVECWGTIGDQARKHVGDGKTVLIVVSALSGMTNLLTRLAEGVPGSEREEIRADIHARHDTLFKELGLRPAEEFLAHMRSLDDLIDSAGEKMDDVLRARLLAHGELLSSSLGCQVLNASGLETHWQDARTILRASADTEHELLSVRCEKN